MEIALEVLSWSWWQWLLAYVPVSYVVGAFVFRRYRIVAVKYKETRKGREGVKEDALGAFLVSPFMLPVFAALLLVYYVWKTIDPLIGWLGDFVAGEEE